MRRAMAERSVPGKAFAAAGNKGSTKVRSGVLDAVVAATG